MSKKLVDDDDDQRVVTTTVAALKAYEHAVQARFQARFECHMAQRHMAQRDLEAARKAEAEAIAAVLEASAVLRGGSRP